MKSKNQQYLYANNKFLFIIHKFFKVIYVKNISYKDTISLAKTYELWYLIISKTNSNFKFILKLFNIYSDFI
jgi:hypothetical protein